MQITDSNGGMQIDGFVDVQASSGSFTGFGVVISKDTTYDCMTEWARGVTGAVGEDGTATMDVSEMILVMGKECAAAGMGDTGVQEFHFSMSLTPTA